MGPRSKATWGFGFEPQMFWGGGRRGRRSWFDPGDMKYVILRMLDDRPMHGYEVMKALEERTCGWYKPSPGTVYPTLQMLEDEGLVTGDQQDGKKVYSITDAGKAFLADHKSTVEDIFDRLEDMMDHFTGDPMPEVNRLVGKLVGQVYRVSWRVRGDETKRKKIAEILESALSDLKDLAV